MSALCVIVPATNPLAAPVSFRELLARERAAPDKIVAYGSSPHQFGELWLPQGKGPHPTLVLIHGGCWLAALPGQELMAYVAQDLRGRGYAVWNIDYRRIGDEGGGYPGTFLDTAAAIDRLNGLAPVHSLDLRKLVVIGHSAGGHLAAWAAGRPRIAKSSALHSLSPLPINAVVSLSGINDLESYRDTGPSACGGPPTIDALVGAKERAGTDLYADTSPIRMLPFKVSQVVVSAELDRIVPPQFAAAYAKAAVAKGDEVKELKFAAAGHFELIDPASDAWPKIRTEIDALAK